jgi:hypothetical protein
VLQCSAMGEFTASVFCCSAVIAVNADCSKVDVEMFWCCQGGIVQGASRICQAVSYYYYIHNSKMGERGKGGADPSHKRAEQYVARRF